MPESGLCAHEPCGEPATITIGQRERAYNVCEGHGYRHACETCRRIWQAVLNASPEEVSDVS
jgi:hypothetical protein